MPKVPKAEALRGLMGTALPGGGCRPHPQELRKNPARRRPPHGPASLHTVLPHPLGQAPREAGAQAFLQWAAGSRPVAWRRGVTSEWTGSLTCLLCFVLTRSCWPGPVGGGTQGQPAEEGAGVARMPTDGEAGVMR